jgi:hypothetical protein
MSPVGDQSEDYTVKTRMVLVFVALATAVLWVSPVGAQVPASAQLPLVVTSCGQSPDAYTVSLLCKRVKLEHTYDNVLKPEQLAGVRTLVVVVGGSAKGLGEAGIDEKAELARVAALVAKAKELKVKVIAVHVGGESRRGQLSDKFIDPVVAKADSILVTEDGNKDGMFTKVAKSRNVPLVVAKQAPDVGRELKAMFVAK